MDKSGNSPILKILQGREADLVAKWVQVQTETGVRRAHLISDSEAREQSAEFIRLLCEALLSNTSGDIQSRAWSEVRDLLGDISRTRAQQGFTPAAVASFVFSFKQVLFTELRSSIGDANSLFDEIWSASRLLDDLGLYTTEVFQKSREEIIIRQQEEMMELSTPVVKLWKGVLALPIIGTLDSARTQVVMENLLQAIVDTDSSIAIIDITAVPTVDTLTSQHLLKTVAAARLMGAECIISGIRPQIAQTIVHLGVDLSEVTTKATLADAFAIALRRLGKTLPTKDV